MGDMGLLSHNRKVLNMSPPATTAPASCMSATGQWHCDRVPPRYRALFKPYSPVDKVPHHRQSLLLHPRHPSIIFLPQLVLRAASLLPTSKGVSGRDIYTCHRRRRTLLLVRARLSLQHCLGGSLFLARAPKSSSPSRSPHAMRRTSHDNTKYSLMTIP
jgi:hypothetical protein